LEVAVLEQLLSQIVCLDQLTFVPALLEYFQDILEQQVALVLDRRLLRVASVLLTEDLESGPQRLDVPKSLDHRIHEAIQMVRLVNQPKFYQLLLVTL